MLIIEASPPRLDKALLKYWSDWMRRMKMHRKHLQRIGHSTQIQDERIDVLESCIRQVEVLRKREREVSSPARE